MQPHKLKKTGKQQIIKALAKSGINRLIKSGII
jgi:hypothetical protein